MSHLSRSNHLSRPYLHHNPISDRDELFPDDSSSLVSAGSNRSSHRSNGGGGGGASLISRSSHNSRRTSRREGNLRREMFERGNLGPIRENYEESHYSRASHRSGGAHSDSDSNTYCRALVRRSDYDDGRSHVSRSSRRSDHHDGHSHVSRSSCRSDHDDNDSHISRSTRHSNHNNHDNHDNSRSHISHSTRRSSHTGRNRDINLEMDSARSDLSRASLSAADQIEALWAKQSQSRSRSATTAASESHHDHNHSHLQQTSRRSTQQQMITRRRSVSLQDHDHDHVHEREVDIDSLSQIRDRYRNHPPHILSTADLRMSSRGMSYNSGLDTRHFRPGDEVDLKSRKNIDHAADGSYRISDEMDVTMRFGAGVVLGFGGRGGLSGLRGGGGDGRSMLRKGGGEGEDIDFDHERREKRGNSLDQREMYCTNNIHTCPIYALHMHGMEGAGSLYRGL